MKCNACSSATSLEIFGWAILGAGVLALVVAAWIFLSFFRALRFNPPLTLRERRANAKKARGGASVRTKGQEAATQASTQDSERDVGT